MAYTVQLLPQSLLNGTIHSNRRFVVNYMPVLAPGISKIKRNVFSVYPQCITISRTLICFDPIISGNIIPKLGEILPED